MSAGRPARALILAVIGAAVLGAAVLGMGIPFPALAAEPDASASGRAIKTATIKAVVRPARVTAGSDVTVVVSARDLHDARAVAFHLVYDPSILVPVHGSASEGGLFRQAGAATSFLSKPASTGDRIIVGIARLGDERGARGDGTLCRFTFKTLKPGATAVALDRARLIGPRAEDLPARFQSGRITIVSGPHHAAALSPP